MDVTPMSTRVNVGSYRPNDKGEYLQQSSSAVELTQFQEGRGRTQADFIATPSKMTSTNPLRAAHASSPSPLPEGKGWMGRLGRM